MIGLFYGNFDFQSHAVNAQLVLAANRPITHSKYSCSAKRGGKNLVISFFSANTPSTPLDLKIVNVRTKVYFTDFVAS